MQENTGNSAAKEVETAELDEIAATTKRTEQLSAMREKDKMSLGSLKTTAKRNLIMTL